MEMAAILTSLRNTVAAGFVLALALLLLYAGLATPWEEFWKFLFRWLHVLSGVMWVGLLWYFNFVQMPSMPKIPDEQKPAVTKVIAPQALFWFRWAAMATLATGLVLAALNGYLLQAATLGLAPGSASGHVAIGVGMWLGVVLWFNVWFVIWPGRRKALGLAPAAPEERAKAARRVMLVSRANAALSVPMLFSMVAAQGLFHIS